MIIMHFLIRQKKILILKNLKYFNLINLINLLVKVNLDPIVLALLRFIFNYLFFIYLASNNKLIFYLNFLI